MRTFWIQTLGCKVNQYESEQIATLLRNHGMHPTDSESADLRIIHTCSVTSEAASKSRSAVRRSVRLPVFTGNSQSKTIVTGCWATSDPDEAAGIAGVDAVLEHGENWAEHLGTLLKQWGNGIELTEEQGRGQDRPGACSLPLLEQRQTGHQRAMIKIQDGCDAHCTYCIIPKLRTRLWSKPVNEVIEESRRLVKAGHVEIVLTGIFLSAYGQSTALHRRQEASPSPLGQLVHRLCTEVDGLERLRLSSLEPGDLTDELIEVFRCRPQVVPHFHLPLQSGSDLILRRMNRQYKRDNYLRMVDRIKQVFDRPALTTDVIVGFPGETEDEFRRTIEVVDLTGFIHIHAFPFSPRPGTAASRWKDQFICGTVVNERIKILQNKAESYSQDYRKQFIGQSMKLLVERSPGSHRHGRCERYFTVHFEGPQCRPGDFVAVRVDRVDGEKTWGVLV